MLEIEKKCERETHREKEGEKQRKRERKTLKRKKRKKNLEFQKTWRGRIKILKMETMRGRGKERKRVSCKE